MIVYFLWKIRIHLFSTRFSILSSSNSMRPFITGWPCLFFFANILIFRFFSLLASNNLACLSAFRSFCSRIHSNRFSSANVNWFRFACYFSIWLDFSWTLAFDWFYLIAILRQYHHLSFYLPSLFIHNEFQATDKTHNLFIMYFCRTCTLCQMSHTSTIRPHIQHNQSFWIQTH